MCRSRPCGRSRTDGGRGGHAVRERVRADGDRRVDWPDEPGGVHVAGVLFPALGGVRPVGWRAPCARTGSRPRGEEPRHAEEPLDGAAEEPFAAVLLHLPQRPHGRSAARSAAGDDDGDQPQGEPGARAPGVHRRGEGASRADPKERGPVHHPSGLGRHDPRRARLSGRGDRRRAPARHGRGHRLLARAAARRVRRGDRRDGRRRHEARQGHLRRGRAGGDRPQDDRRDEPRRAGAADQAGRPAAQRAHLEVRPGRLRRAEGEGDPRDLRAAGASARAEHHEVGARGPLLPGALSEGVRGDRLPRRAARARPGAVPLHRLVPDQRGPPQGAHQGRGHRAAQALLLDLPEDDRARPRLLRHLRPGGRAGPGGHGARLLRRAGHPARPLVPGPGPVQGLHRPAEVQPVPVSAHHGDRPHRQTGRGADPHPGDAPPGGVRRRGALEVQGDVRQPGRRRRRPGHQRRGLAASAHGLAEGDHGLGGVPRLAALRDQHAGGLRLHPEGGRAGPAAGSHARGLRLLGAHRGGPSHHRGARERAARLPRVDPLHRGRGRGVHLEVRRRRPQPRLARLREVPARTQQDPALVLQGAPRRGAREGQGGARQGAAPAGPPDASPADP